MVGVAIGALLYPFEAIANIITAIGLAIDIVKLKGSEWLTSFKKLISNIFTKPVQTV